MALVDGARLARALVARSHPDELNAAIAEYETEMFARADATARMSARMHDLLTSPDAAQKMLAFFARD